MMVSTRGRYALRVMLDLAAQKTGEYILLMDISARQEISEKYLESIMSSLSKHGFVDSLRGRGGGYKLSKAPEEYTVGSILEITEGSLAPVACLDCEENTCKRASECKTLKMWKKFYGVTKDFFNNITLADLLANDVGDNYII